MPLLTDYTNNQCLAAPGLAITGSSSTTVKYTNTWSFKANGRISATITTANAPSLSLATYQAPYPNGTAAVAGNLATLYTRVYTLIATLPVNGTNTATPTFSWIASPDFLTSADLVSDSNFAVPDQSNQCAVGYVTVKNATGSAFVPGTTALDTGSLTVTYLDNYAKSGS